MITIVLFVLLRTLCNILEQSILILYFTFLEILLKKGDVALHRVDTEHQLADIFTKPLDSSRFAFLWGELGVIHPMGLF